MAKVIFDSAFSSANNTITNSSRTVEYTGGSTGGLAFTSVGHRREKWYCEFFVDDGNTTALNLGIGLVAADQAFTSTDYVGKAVNSYSYWSNGVTKQNNADTAGFATFTTGDIIMMAVDFQNLKIWFGKNGTWFGNPEAGTFQAYTMSSITRAYFPAVSCYTPNRKVTIKADAANQVYQPPRNFTPWEDYVRHSANDIGATTSTTSVLYASGRNVFRNSTGDGPATLAIDFKKSGKWYFEYKVLAIPVVDNFATGLQASDNFTASWLGAGANGWGFWYVPGANSVQRWTGGTNNGTVTIGTNTAVNDIHMYAVDADTGKIWYGHNNVWLSSGDPAAGTNAIFTDTDITTFGFAPGCSPDQNHRLQLLSRSAELTYSPPAGFAAFDDSTVTIPADNSNIRVSRVGLEVLTQIPFNGLDTELVQSYKSARVSGINLEVLSRVYSERSSRVSNLGFEALCAPDTNFAYTTSIDFDGVDDYVTFPANSISGTLKNFTATTVSFWFKFDQAFAGTNGQKNVLFNIPIATGVTGLTGYVTQDGRLGFGARSQSGDTLQTLISSATFLPDEWYQVNMVANFTAKTMKIYQLGSLDNSSSSLAFGQNVFTTTTNATLEEIGRNSAFANSNFDGHLIDLKFYVRERDANTSLQDSTYYEYRSRNTEGLAALLRLNEMWPYAQPLVPSTFKVPNGTYNGSPMSSNDIPFITANTPIQFNFSLPYDITILTSATHLFSLSYSLGLLSEPGNAFDLSYVLGLLGEIEHVFNLSYDVQTAQLIEYDSPMGLEMISEAGAESLNSFKFDYTVATVATVTPTFNLPYTLILEDGVYVYNLSYTLNKEESLKQFNLLYKHAKIQQNTKTFSLPYELNKDANVSTFSFSIPFGLGLNGSKEHVFNLGFHFKYDKENVFRLAYRSGRMQDNTHTFQAPYQLSRLSEDSLFKTFLMSYKHGKSKDNKYTWDFPYTMYRSQELDQHYDFSYRLRMIETDLSNRITYTLNLDNSVDMVIDILQENIPLGAYYIVVDNGGRYNKFTTLVNKGQDVSGPVQVTFDEEITLTTVFISDPEKIYTTLDVDNYNGYYGWPNASSLHPLASGIEIANSGFVNGIPGQRPYSNDADFYDIVISDEGFYIFDLEILPDANPKFTEVLYLIDKATNRIIRTGFAGTNEAARVIAYLKNGQYRLVPTAVEVDRDNSTNTYRITAWGESFNNEITFLDPGYSITDPEPINPEFDHSISEFVVTIKGIEKESSINITFLDHDLNELPETLPSQIYISPADQLTLIPTQKIQEGNRLRAPVRIIDPCCFNKKINLEIDSSCSIPDEIKVDLDYNTNRVLAAVNKRFNLNSLIFFDD